MKTLFDRLDAEQKRIVACEDKAILVEGVVGSGKTDTLIAKILHLIYNKNVPAEKILVLAYNHATVKEIQRRLELYLLNSGSETYKPKIHTFHSWFAQLLRYELPIQDLELTPDFSVCNGKENEFFFPSGYAASNKTAGDQKMLKDILHQLEMQRIDRTVLQQELNTVFFDELFIYANELDEKHSAEGPEWIFVDEIQNVAQEHLSFLRRFYQTGSHIMFLGDFNQKIYPIKRTETFRQLGNELRYFLKDCFQPTELTLSVNYRSAPVIVEAAKSFQIEKDAIMIAHRSDNGAKIVIRKDIHRNKVGDKIASDIEYLRHRGVPYSDMAILVKDKNDRRDVKAGLDERQIPIYGSRDTGGELKETLEWLVHLFLVSINQYDLYAEFMIGDSANQLSKQIKTFRRRCNVTVEIDGLGEKLYRFFELESQIVNHKLTRQEHTDIFRTFLHDMEKYLKNSNAGSLSHGIIDYITLCRLDQEKLLGIIEQDHDSVRLLTFHSSSGLEFKHVWMYGDFIPYKKNYSTYEFEFNEDEERLFYVGLTRASESITLLSKASGDVPKDGQFIDLIPKDLIQTDEISKPAISTEQVSYVGKKCVDGEYGEGIITEQTAEGLNIFYSKYGDGHKEFCPNDEIEFINWII